MTIELNIFKRYRSWIKLNIKRVTEVMCTEKFENFFCIKLADLLKAFHNRAKIFAENF